MAERRRVPRRRIRAMVGLLHKGEYNVFQALQLGEGGLLIDSSKELELGDRLVLTFRIPFGPTVVATATVRYRLEENASNYGVEFLNLDFTIRRAIRNFVASQTAEADR